MANILNGLNIAFGLSPNGRIYFADYGRVGSLFFDEWKQDIVGVVVSNIKDFCQTFQQLKKKRNKNKVDIVRLSVSNSAFHPSDFFFLPLFFWYFFKDVSQNKNLHIGNEFLKKNRKWNLTNKNFLSFWHSCAEPGYTSLCVNIKM